MSDDQNVAYVNGMAAKTIAEAFGLMSENMKATAEGSPIPYGRHDFDKLVEENGMHHNAMLSLFYEG